MFFKSNQFQPGDSTEPRALRSALLNPSQICVS